MIIDSITVDDLALNAEEAFVVFEERLRRSLSEAQVEDRRQYQDENGYYTGSHAPERYYVSSILAFLDEYDLEIDVVDVSGADDREFPSLFNGFFDKINYIRTRFKLRRRRIDTGEAGTPILIKGDFKDEIHHCLATIRKIVNCNITEGNKREAIFKRIAGLESEIDRDRTTIDAVFSRLIDLSRTIETCADHLEPLVQKLERVFRAIYQGADHIPLLPKKERPQLLPSSKAKGFSDVDEDIPF